MINTNQALVLLDREVVGADGAMLGTVAQIFVEPDTGRPKWVGVAASPLSKRLRILPLTGATLTGDLLSVPFDGRTVVNAPALGGFANRLSEQHEALLHHYYGMPTDDSRPGTPFGSGADRPRASP